VCACDAAVAATIAGHLAELGYAPDRARPEAQPALTAARLAERAEPEIAILAAGPGTVAVAAATASAIRAEPMLDGLPLLVALDAATLDDVPALAGADEVVVAPASAAELRLRIARAWQRAGATAEGDTLTLDALVLNVATHETTIDGAPIDLTHMEHRLLRFLLAHPRRVFAREALLERVWGYEHYGQTRTVDVHVRRLRAKLGDEYGARIETVRSVGYRLAR
jgi:DNA-binding response OmpR family regulator